MTVLTTVTLSKTHTMLKIFQACTLVSKKDRIKLRVSEYLIIAVLLIVDIFLLIISFVDTTISDEYNFIEQYCSNQLHITTQFIDILVLLVFNSIQAGRARHLPINFRETRIIILTNILSMFSLIITPWLAIYEKPHRQKKNLLSHCCSPL